ncbi:MAG: helix-turn-helix domain-containing protein, partial [Planctomycetota bacterium]
TLADLAAEANLSPEHFARRFRKRYGASPIAYQHSLRIQAARVLLSSSDLLCKEIAARVGFSDIYAFSKAFRKATGLAPTAYREQAHPDV